MPPRAPPLLPRGLIRPVATQLGRQVLLELPGSNSQTLGPTPWDRTRLLPALLVQLALGLQHPPRPSLRPGEDPLSIETIQRIIDLLHERSVLLCLRFVALLLLERTRQPFTATSLRGELRR